MATAKQCDRCKTFYIFNDICELPDPIYRYSIIKDMHPYPEIKMDLCPNCLKELVKWIGEGNGT